MPGAPSSLQGQEPLIASLLLVVMPGAPSSFLLQVAMPFATSSNAVVTTLDISRELFRNYVVAEVRRIAVERAVLQKT